MSTDRNERRAGFTLIELLVVISIIAFVAGLLVLFGPGLFKNAKASRGAQTVQGVLFIAKQQALRDKAPYGVRLLTDADGQVRSLQYIQLPPDYTGGTAQAATDNTTTPPTFSVTFVLPPGQSNLWGGYGPGDPTLWSVQPGDFISIRGGTMHRITGVTPTAVTLASDATNGAGTSLPATEYRIVRSPRAVPGEDVINLPDDVIVDMTRSLIAADGATGNFDILFAPWGTVLGSAGQSGKVVLWVRDSTQDPATTIEQSLITVFTRSGLIASYEVDTGSGNPYSFVLDPRAAGGL